MYSIDKDIESKITIKNSKFITYLFYVDTKENIESKLDYIKSIYKDATHITYAYVIENSIKAFDDNEPSNTAGKPMLNILQKRDLFNILVITIRYFGGIKLGANGLIRAYSTSVSEALNKCNVINLIRGYNVDIIFNYNNISKIDYLLNQDSVIVKEFNDNIKYNANVSDNLLQILKGIKDIEIIINKNIYIKEKK